jgi:uncharacterized protein
MTRYQLAKLVEWAGTLNSRKRLQKVVFMLQAAGCPLGADYILHHYGPYSQEVAQLSDEMAHSNLLEEVSEPNRVGLQYSYDLTEHAKEKLAELEATPQGEQMAEQLVPFKKKAKELLKTDLWALEVASTMVYFRQQGHNWPESVERTCKFKNIDRSTASGKQFVNKAEEIAQQVVA